VYIRINLLPREFRPRKTLIAFDFKLILILFIVLGSAGLGGYYFYISRSLKQEETKLTNLRYQKNMLKDTVDLKSDVEALKKKISERVMVIKELTGDSAVRFDMLKHINSIIPENLWLLNISENNQNSKVQFTIEGTSYAKKDISRFLEGLENYKKFRNVALESIVPAPLESQDAFQFIVKVELMTSVPEGAAKSPAVKPAPSTKK
jgi:Tfp pilus assembly protein PilN